MAACSDDLSTTGALTRRASAPATRQESPRQANWRHRVGEQALIDCQLHAVPPRRQICVLAPGGGTLPDGPWRVTTPPLNRTARRLYMASRTGVTEMRLSQRPCGWFPLGVIVHAYRQQIIDMTTLYSIRHISPVYSLECSHPIQHLSNLCTVTHRTMQLVKVVIVKCK